MATMKKLSNVEFITGIESVSRKFARRIDTASNKYVVNGSYVSGSEPANDVDCKVIPGQAYFGSVSRTVQVFGVGNVRKNTFFVRKPFAAKAATSSQIAVRGVKTIGYQTMRGWMMACAIAKLTTGETLPTNHKLVLDA